MQTAGTSSAPEAIVSQKRLTHYFCFLSIRVFRGSWEIGAAQTALRRFNGSTYFLYGTNSSIPSPEIHPEDAVTVSEVFDSANKQLPRILYSIPRAPTNALPRFDMFCFHPYQMLVYLPPFDLRPSPRRLLLELLCRYHFRVVPSTYP